MADEQRALALMRAADPAARMPEPERSFDPLRQRIAERIARLDEPQARPRDTGKEHPMQTTTPPTRPAVSRRPWIVATAAAAAVVVAVAVGALVVTSLVDTPDTVTPPTSIYEEGTVLHLLDTDGRFDTFLSLLVQQDEGLVERVGSADFDRTLFVPTDEAFAALGDDALREIVEGPNLSRLVNAHIVLEGVGGLRADDLTDKRYQNPGAASLTQVTVDGDRITYGPATVIETDIPAADGIIHVIDTVVIPWES